MDNKSMDKRYKFSFKFSLFILLIISMILTLGISFSVPTSVLLLIILIFLFVISLLNKVPYKDIEAAMINGVKSVNNAIIILLLVGVIIATWIKSGIVPMIIYYGLDTLNPDILLPITFILCAIMSICTGSSWGTCGTIGIAFVSIGESLGVPTYVIVGAVISGATVGDKISTLSDTTIVASSIAEVDIYRHIKSMMYTTTPTFLICLIAYFFIGKYFGGSNFDPQATIEIKDVLYSQFKFSPLLLLLPISIFIMSIKKTPAILSLLISGILGAIAAVVVQGNKIIDVLQVMYKGNISSTGIDIVDGMLTNGGLVSMFPTVCIIIFALGIGGILNDLKILNPIIERLKKVVKTDEGLVVLTLICGSITVITLSSLYVSAILVGKIFKNNYDERNIDRSILSRSIEESTTITTPLIPWHSSYIYYTQLFNLTNMQFVPFTIFCWLNLVISIVLTKLGVFTPLFRGEKLFKLKIKEEHSNC